MKKIESFCIDHNKFLPGIYVSRRDNVVDQCVTTFDLRITRPNKEPVMNTAEIHAMEHLAATYLRNNKETAAQTIYFGPMGCRTGFYLIVSGQVNSEDILGTVIEVFEFIRDYEGAIPGASPVECGNYLDLNLPMAKYWADKYLNDTLYNITTDRLYYPE